MGILIRLTSSGQKASIRSNHINCDPLPEESYESNGCNPKPDLPRLCRLLYYLRFYNYIMKKQVVGILLAAITSVIGLEQQSALARTSSEDRHVGFSDGCKGVPLTEDHTKSYLDGYSEGQTQCHNNNGASGGGSSGNGGSNSRNTGSGNAIGNIVGKGFCLVITRSPQCLAPQGK